MPESHLRVLVAAFWMILAFWSSARAEPDRMLKIRGSVADDATSAPIPWAAISRITEPDYSKTPFSFFLFDEWTTADTFGCFEIDASGESFDGSLATLAVSALGRAHVMISDMRPPAQADDGVIELDVRLIQSVELTGRVLDPAGSAAPGVQVIAMLANDRETEERVTKLVTSPNKSQGSASRTVPFPLCLHTTTGDDGTFRIEGWRPGDRVHLVALRDGSLPAFKEFVDVGSGSIEVRMAGGAATLSGVVRDAGEIPLAGTLVTANLLAAKDDAAMPEEFRLKRALSTFHAFTDHQGKYEFNTLWEGDYTLSAIDFRSGFRSETIRKEVLHGSNAPIDLQLQGAIVLIGNARDSTTGQPLAGIGFAIPTETESVPSLAVSDSDGSFTLKLAERQERIHYWWPRETGTFDPDPDGTVYLDQLPPSGTFQQRFLMSKPVQQVVHLSAAPEVRMEDLSVIVFSTGGQRTIHPDSEGIISFPAETGRMVSINCRDTEQRCMISRHFEITQETITEPMKLQLEMAAEVSGTVVDETGKPCERIIVDAPQARGESNIPFTGSDGRFHIKMMKPGPAELQVIGAELLNRATPFPIPLDLKPGDVMENIRIVLKPGGTIRGRVIDEDGEPRQVQVRLTATSEAGTSVPIFADADEAGEFGFDNVPLEANGYTIETFPYTINRNVLTFKTLPTEAIELQMNARDPIMMTMITEQGGERVTDYQFEIFRVPEDGDLDQRLRDGTYEFKIMDDGRLRLSGLMAALYRIRAMSRTSQNAFLAGSFTFNSNDPERREFDVTLEPAAKISGRVVSRADGEHKPISGARIKAQLVLADYPQPDRESGTMDSDREALTDAHGSFVLEGLFDETYELLIEPPRPYAATSYQVDCSTLAAPVDFEVSAGGALTIRTIGLDGKPGRMAINISAQSPSSALNLLLNWRAFQAALTSNVSGILRLENLPNCMLTASPILQGLDGEWKASISPGSETELVIDLSNHVEVLVLLRISPEQFATDLRLEMINQETMEAVYCQLRDSSGAHVLIPAGTYRSAVRFGLNYTWLSDEIKIEKASSPQTIVHEIERIPVTIQLKGAMAQLNNTARLDVHAITGGGAGSSRKCAGFWIGNKTSLGLHLAPGDYEFTVTQGAATLGTARLRVESGKPATVEIKVTPPPVPKGSGLLEVG